jgi:AraC family transcriptional regulator of adaptative response/methylated-DNA-[protein]-cysteine methyltransferase
MATLNLAVRRADWPRMGNLNNTSAPATYGGRMRSRVKTGAPATYGGQVKYTVRDGGAGELVMNTASFGPHGNGARVAYTIVDLCFGRILIATTRTGVCWIGLSDSEAHLEGELHGDLSTASCSRDNDGLAAIARSVVDFVAGRTSEIVLPVDFRATPFQLAVWQQLCAIPWGETRSYGEIARRLGRPDASRAVGAANGSNPLAIMIPCHRAVGADGSLTGYRWGLEYKRRLLRHERSLAQSEGPFRLTGQRSC